MTGDKMCKHGLWQANCKRCDPIEPLRVDCFVSEFDNQGRTIVPTVFVSFDGSEPREVETYLG